MMANALLNLEPARARSSQTRSRPTSPSSIERVHLSVYDANAPGITDYRLQPGAQRESIHEFAHRMDLRHQGRKVRDKTGTAAEEAAWQLLRPFINPLDCNHYVNMTRADGTHLDDVYCMNTSETLNRVFNHEAVYNLKRFGKSNFLQHCRGLRTYYYRCRTDALYSTGYGNGKHCHHRLPFDAAAFGMDGKRMVNPDLGILLLGLDIDCHHGETDVAKTTALILEYFPNAYTEPSTNGQGCHVYVKTTYPINCHSDWMQTFQYINVIAEMLADIIEAERIRRGYDAPLDKIRGLPSVLGRDNGRLSVVKRSHVIKIPFYRGCSMEAVTWFYQAPWYSLQDLENIVLSKVVGNSDDAGDYNNDVVGAVDEAGSGTGLGSVTHLSTTPPNRAYPAVRNANEIGVADLVAVEDSRERRLAFGLRLCRQLGRVPLAQELKAEYVKSGLFKVSSKSDNDNNRYKQLVALLAKSFNPTKVEFHYRDYPSHRVATEAMVAAKTAGMKLEWRKDKTKPIKLEKLAALYWSIRHSQGTKYFTRFSYKHVVTALKATIGQSAHRNEIARLLAILEEAGLIARVAPPVWNGETKLGQGWRVTVSGGS